MNPPDFPKLLEISRTLISPTLRETNHLQATYCHLELPIKRRSDLCLFVHSYKEERWIVPLVTLRIDIHCGCINEIRPLISR